VKFLPSLSLPLGIVKLLLVASLFLVISCDFEPSVLTTDTYKLRSSAEFLDPNGKKMLLDSTEIEVSGIASRTTEAARSGTHCLRLTKEAPYGFTVHLENVKVDEQYTIEVWVKDAPDIRVALVAQGTNFYRIFSDLGVAENGWIPISHTFSVPPNIGDKKLKFYVWNPGDNPVFVDDFVLEKLDANIHYDFGITPFRLYLEPPSMQHLEKLRREAFEQNVLVTSDDSWVKAAVFAENDLHKAKLRLKGDWTDHLEGRKWSFRVKLKGESAWKGMRTFSLQTPAARSFLLEWLLHQVAEGEGLLTTTYDFVPLHLGQKDLGLYVYEEHFEKQLLERRNRREGPIVKFSEDAFWQANLTETWTEVPYYPASEISPFGAGRLVKDSLKTSQFKVASTLLHSVRKGEIDSHHIIDKEKMGVYYAIMDAFRGFHGAAWHNMRFYYNPISSSLEPIIYDAFSNGGIHKEAEKSSLYPSQIDKLNPSSQYSLAKYLFLDQEIYNSYEKSLRRFSSESYIDSVLTVLDEDLVYREQLIRKEFKDYHFDREQVRRCAANSRELLASGRMKYHGPKENLALDSSSFEIKTYLADNVPFLVNVYKQNSTSYRLENFYEKELELIGIHDGDVLVPNENSIVVPPSEYGRPAAVTVDGIADGQSIVFKVKGQADELSTEIMQWPSPETISIRRPETTSTHPNILMEEHVWTLQGPEITFKSPIVVPRGKTLIIPAGTQIDLVEEAFILSYSPVQINGESENRVSFTSSDRTGLGLSVLSAPGLTSISHCDYAHMNDFIYDRWSLSGSLNIYESEVRIDDLQISSNYCEDALNIIRSSFDITNSGFRDIYADAFDSDFSQGTLSQSVFERVGNDGIDFSGSQVKVTTCTFRDIGDKGVSGGEASHLDVSDCQVERANIGVASKDKSVVALKRMTIEDCNYGLVALRKKPEYGPAQISAIALSSTSVDTPLLLEKGSFLLLDGDSIPGREKNVAARFY